MDEINGKLSKHTIYAFLNGENLEFTFLCDKGLRGKFILKLDKKKFDELKKLLENPI